MQVFGLELRRSGNIQNLYKDVDIVLKNFDINAVKQGAIAHALQKMLSTQNHFSICTIKNCMEMAQISIANERIAIYQSQHCMDWGEMLPEFRQILIAMVLEDFRSVLAPDEIIKSER